MLEICALASGSNGNCYYVGNQHDAILVDAGISARQLMLRFKETGLDPEKVKAIFISHEHADHARGMQVLSKRLGVNVYMTSRTYYALPKPFRPDLVRFFHPGIAVETGSFMVYPILKKHDAAEPCSFRIEHNSKSVGVFTDIGDPCTGVKSAVGQCHALFLESNYDEKMLWEGSYPWHLKRRVSSPVGHLSNIQALELVTNHAHPDLECIFLSHLSGENNTPDTAISVFGAIRDRVKVKLTDRQAAGEVYRLETL